MHERLSEIVGGANGETADRIEPRNKNESAQLVAPVQLQRGNRYLVRTFGQGGSIVTTGEIMIDSVNRETFRIVGETKPRDMSDYGLARRDNGQFGYNQWLVPAYRPTRS